MTTPNTPAAPDANALLMDSGKSMKGKSASFRERGANITGYLSEPARTVQQRDDDGNPETWDNGDPKWQVVVTLTGTGQVNPALEEDDGVRALYLKGSVKSESKSLFAAVRDAVQKSGAPGLEVGGWLGVTYVGDGPKGPNAKPSHSAPKQFEARYVPPAGAAMGAPEAPAAPTAPAAPEAPAAPSAPAQAAAPAVEQTAATPAAPGYPADRPGDGEASDAAATRLGLPLDVVKAIAGLPNGWDDPTASVMIGMARQAAGANA